MAKDTFETLRPKIDEAIRAGLSLKEFLELHEINKNVWYTIKPKSFNWIDIQKKLGVERKIEYKKKPGTKTKENLPKWDNIKDEVLKAIQNGWTMTRFCKAKGLKKSQWYQIKPKGFDWQQELVKVSGNDWHQEQTPVIEQKDLDVPKKIDMKTLYLKMISHVSGALSEHIVQEGLTYEIETYLGEINRLVQFIRTLENA